MITAKEARIITMNTRVVNGIIVKIDAAVREAANDGLFCVTVPIDFYIASKSYEEALRNALEGYGYTVKFGNNVFASTTVVIVSWREDYCNTTTD